MYWYPPKQPKVSCEADVTLMAEAQKTRKVKRKISTVPSDFQY